MPSFARTKAEVYAMPLDSIDVSQPQLYQNDTIGWYFERLRAEAPVHYCADSRVGPYWSITRFDDILAVDSDHARFSSDAFNGGIQIFDFPPGMERVNFINMDPPQHDEQRGVVSPVLAPRNLAGLRDGIRHNVGDILDNLPEQADFDWVDRVSVELTTRMLATLFDFPMAQRRKLTWWSDVATMDINAGGAITSEKQRLAELADCLATFRQLLSERAKVSPKNDLVSMLAHSPMFEMADQELLSTLILLIIGGNDTTRNSITGGLLALLERPEQYAKLRANPDCVTSLVPEIIRWQTPLTAMRRTTTEAVELAGTKLPAGSKVVMWYLSGNRDERVIADADQFIVDRKNSRHHLSFGFGIHRCLGNRLAELQLRILWEEMLARGFEVELAGKPQRTYSAIVRGFTKMPVRRVHRSA